MEFSQTVSAYISLSDHQKVEFLARVSHALTIDFRDIAYHEAKSLENTKKLQGINELQHHLASQRLARYRHDQARYPDQVFLAILQEKADYYGILGRLKRCLERHIPSDTQLPMPDHETNRHIILKPK